MCYCNRGKDQHRDKDVSNEESKWNMKHNTSEKINPVHGLVFSNGAPVTEEVQFYYNSTFVPI